MSIDICTPIVIIDLVGSTCLIIISALCLKVSRQIVKKEPDNFLYGYLHWLFIALFAFSLSRSLGHIVKHVLIFAKLSPYWAALSPISGSINSALFILIASISVFFQTMKKVMERIERDRMEIERISQELLRLNKETELLVTERTRAELALSIAHNIRNPIMVIGGIAKRLLKKEKLTEEQRKKMELILAQTKRLDDIVREFELIKGERRGFIAKKNLNELVKEVVEAASSEAKSIGITIEANLESTPMYVDMDPNLIKFALAQCLKLIIYRMKASKKIVVRVIRGKFGCVITLFPSEFLGYQKKQMQRSPTQLRFTGKRLGLSTVRQILKDHGGNLWITGHGEFIKIQIFLPFNIGTGKTWSKKKDVRV